jgi:hypothetical protein
MIRQVDLAWISLGVVDERRERPGIDPALRVDRAQRDAEKEFASRAARLADEDAAAQRERSLRPTRSGAF